MFNIQGGVAVAPALPQRGRPEITEGDFKNMTADMHEIPYDQWNKIPIASVVRYRRKDGVYSRGGIMHSRGTGKAGEPVFNMESEGSGRRWPIPLSIIGSLWCSWDPKSPPPATPEDIRNAINDLNKAVRQMYSDIAEIRLTLAGRGSPRVAAPPQTEQRLIALENAVGRIIKKLGPITPR